MCQMGKCYWVEQSLWEANGSFDSKKKSLHCKEPTGSCLCLQCPVSTCPCSERDDFSPHPPNLHLSGPFQYYSPTCMSS